RASKTVVTEPVVGIQFIVLMIPVASAMPGIGAALRDHLHFSACGTSEIGARVVGGHTEFLETLDRSRNYRSSSRHKPRIVATTAFHFAGRATAVDHKSGLIRARRPPIRQPGSLRRFRRVH